MFIVDDKKDSGEVLIHFDGWTSKYDYWTMSDSPDLHPIGFMAQRAQDHPEWTPELQAPKGQRVHLALQSLTFTCNLKSDACNQQNVTPHSCATPGHVFCDKTLCTCDKH